MLFRSLWEESFAALKSEIEQGTPIIGLEPACTSAFKDELPGLFSKRLEAKRLSEQVVHFTDFRSEEHTSDLQSLLRHSYAVFCLKTKIKYNGRIRCYNITETH